MLSHQGEWPFNSLKTRYFIANTNKQFDELKFIPTTETNKIKFISKSKIGNYMVNSLFREDNMKSFTYLIINNYID